MAYATSAFFAGTAAKKFISEPQRQAKKARQASLKAHQDARESAEREGAQIAHKAKLDREERLQDVARNKTIVSDPLGLSGKAKTVRKILTGQ